MASAGARSQQKMYRLKITDGMKKCEQHHMHMSRGSTRKAIGIQGRKEGSCTFTRGCFHCVFIGCPCASGAIAL
eukprot:6485596-Amphidinium_carterae.1